MENVNHGTNKKQKRSVEQMRKLHERQRTFRGIVAYDGHDFAGWLVQPGETMTKTKQGAHQQKWSVQGSMQTVLGLCLARHCATKEERDMEQNVTIIGSGRTDVGVHARGQVFSFGTNSTTITAKVIEEAFRSAFIRRAFRGVIREGALVVRDVQETHKSFHANMDVVEKTYSYLLCEGSCSPFMSRYCWSVLREPNALNLDSMRAVACELVGKDMDYMMFRKPLKKGEDDDRPNIRRLFRCDIENVSTFYDDYHGPPNNNNPSVSGRFFRVTLSCDFFLYRMVRRFVGTLVQVGLGRLSVEEMLAMLTPSESSEYHKAKATKIIAACGGVVMAPPQGLVLEAAEYPKE